MSLALKSLGRGTKRIISVPRLSLSLIIALGSTLGAVLCVTAIVSALIVKPLPGVSNAASLSALKLNVTFGGSFKLDFITAHALNHASEHFKDIGLWTSVEATRSSIDVETINHPVTLFNAGSNATDVLGTRLILGDFVTNEKTQSHAWISSSLWQSAYSGLTTVLGKTMTINGQQYIIAGVLEDTLAITSNDPILPNQVWRYSDFSKALGMTKTDNIGNNSLKNIFIKPHNDNISMPTDDEILQWYNLYVDTQITVPGIQDFVRSMPMESSMTDYRASFLDTSYNLAIGLSITALGLLLMASLNLVNLFLSHYQSRSKEFAVQLSMGATPLKLRGLMILENLPSFALAGIFGALLGAWLIKALPLLSNNEMPMLSAISIDKLTLIVGAIIVLSLSIVFGLLSITNINKHNLQSNLNSSGKGTAAQSSSSISRALMILQISIASVLMTGSVMLAKNTYDEVNQNLGFSLDLAQQISFNIKDEQWIEQLKISNQADALNNEYQDFIKQLGKDVTAKIPDSEVALVNDGGLLSGSISLRSNSSTENPEQMLTYQVYHYDAGYFDALDIPVLAGTPLTAQEIAEKSNKVIIDERFARELFPEIDYQKIIGQQLPTDEEKIVGAIVAETGFEKTRIGPSIYTPHHSVSRRITYTLILPLGVKLSSDELKVYFEKQYPQLELVEAKSLKDIWLEMTVSDRLTLYVLIAITLLTIILAAIGISGLTLMTTHQKKYELAIRMATGARQSSLMRFVIKDTMWILIIGLLIGFTLSVSGYDWLKENISLLPEFNWLTLGSLDIGLVIVVLLSVIFPTWRVIKQDPLNALRQE